MRDGRTETGPVVLLDPGLLLGLVARIILLPLADLLLLRRMRLVEVEEMRTV